MSRKRDLTSASTILQKLFQSRESNLAEGFTRWQLWMCWDQVVGQGLAQKAIPVGYQKGVLYLWVSSAPLMQELVFLAPEICKKVNAHLGRKWIKSVRFTRDRKDVPDLESAPESLKRLISGP